MKQQRNGKKKLRQEQDESVNRLPVNKKEKTRLPVNGLPKRQKHGNAVNRKNWPE